MYISGAPCPMCMSAIYWARIDAVYFANGLEATSNRLRRRISRRRLHRPNSARRIKMVQFRPDLAEAAYRAWEIRADKDPY